MNLRRLPNHHGEVSLMFMNNDSVDVGKKIFLFFLEGHKNCRVGIKKTGLVRLAETQVFFFLRLIIVIFQIL